ncbi:Major facilitator, sugar transporter-like [Dillenia turbinata]|uniref:Major facilitator, sugar transporter-like n=1 Tax=Dillenia turbinata TaxID=194707 RepID=A0AAN8UDL5_9MAGN
MKKPEMRGRQREGSQTHKRMPSREYLNALDKEENSVQGQNGIAKDKGTPSWRHSFPHVLVATISSFLFGYHLGVVNETLESISYDLDFSGNTLAEGLVVSTCLGGAFVGSSFSGWIADGLGRRRSFQLLALPMIIGASISATTTSLGGMLLGRAFVGTGMGLGPPVAALYVSEVYWMTVSQFTLYLNMQVLVVTVYFLGKIMLLRVEQVSPSSVRGAYGSFIQISTCLGLMVSLFIGIPAKGILGWWRICFWVSAIPAASLAILMEFCAESPHWLVKKGRGAEAEVQFEKLLGGSHAKSAMAELFKSDRGDDADSIKITELLCGRHFSVVLMGSILFALQQLSGINAVFYFSSAVFNRAGVPSDIGNICIGIANLSGSIAAMILMDKLGRKFLLIWSFMGMAVAMGIQATAACSIVSGSGEMYLSVGGMLLFVLTFALGAGPVPGLLLSEIFPNQIRAEAMAVCQSVHWVINFFVGLLFLRLLEQLGPVILYTIFSSFCLIAAVFVKRNVLETKGKTLQEIEVALQAND